MAARVQSPEKELRFTRAGQAVLFLVISAVFAAIAVTLLATALYRDINPSLPHPLWALPPALAAVSAARVATWLTRHAYLILTPLGIEIFPFFRPASGMQMVAWREIAEAEIDPSNARLTLHFNGARTAGIHLSLRPIRADRRELLAKAVLARTGGIGMAAQS